MGNSVRTTTAPTSTNLLFVSRRSAPRGLLGVFLTVAACSCGNYGPALTPNYHCSGTYESCSSLIVVAKLNAIRSTRRTAEIGPSSGIVKGFSRMTLFEVKAEIENVLKGTLSRSSITFYYYGIPQDEGTVGSQAFLPDVGSRYVLYLREDNGVIRTVIDWAGWPHKRVFAGYHPPGFVNSGWAVRERVARIILAPGEGFDHVKYAQNLDRAASQSESLIGPMKTKDMLESLLTRHECVIRSAACLVLAQSYPGHDSCLLATEHDHCLGNLGTSVTLGLDIPRWLANAEERAKRLVLDIEDPTIPIRDGPPEYRKEFLEILATHPDRRVSTAARLALDGGLPR
jgi:hypothetical protein